MTNPALRADDNSGQVIRIRISTWTDLPGFYPSGIKANARLGWYARHFDVVEINTSFYQVVAPHTYQKWLEQTPDSLMFDIKAFRELTHERHVRPDAIFHRFRNSLQTLRADRRLGAVLFQFPPSFICTAVNRAFVASLPNQMPGDQLVVEFRHVSWFDGENKTGTIELLRDRNIALAVVDEPFLPPHTVPLEAIATCEALAYVRLHGRNANGWFAGRHRRYAYDYSREELNEIASTVRELAGQSRQVHVVFNNNSTGAGTVNAQQLAKLLGVSSSGTMEQPMRQALLLDLP